MSTASMQNPNTEFELTQEDFEFLRDHITKLTGIQLPDHKKALMYTRLARRLRALEIDSFKEYRTMLDKQIGMGDNEELLNVVNAMTTNVTAFFREEHHFKDLTEHLPRLIERFGRVRIWSSASSTGEEPWSIAMTVAEYKAQHPMADIKIVASDIDTNAVENCKKGEYEMSEEDFKKHKLLKKYMEEYEQAEPSISVRSGFKKAYRIKPELKRLVDFRNINLLHAPYALPFDQLHVIFCRNVIIYFGKETKVELFRQFSKLLQPEGLMMIGHSESLMGISDDYELLGRTLYKRKGA